MGKKRLRKKYTSKGRGEAIDRKVTLQLRKEKSVADRHLDKLRAWERMENPWITIANPNPNETNKPFVRVRANDYFGNPKRHWSMPKDETAAN